MKKLLSISLIAIVSLCLLAACGGSAPATSAESEAPASSAPPAGSESGAAPAPADKKVSFNLSVPDPEESSIGVAAKEFARMVGERSGGNIELQVYANGSLYGGDSAAGIKQLGAGGLDMVILSTSLYASFNPAFNVISIPYLFDDKEQFISYLNGDLGTSLMDSVESMNIKRVGTWTRSFRQITNSKKPINEPGDLKGIVLRVPNNPLWVEFFGACGATCTPMSFSEVYNALQLKTLDGQENPVDVPLDNKFFEVQKYISLTNHMADAWLAGINQAKFDALSSEQQEILLSAGADMQQWKLDYDAGVEESALKTLRENGMEANDVSPENMQKFIAVSQGLYDTFKDLVKDDELFAKTTAFVGKDA